MSYTLVVDDFADGREMVAEYLEFRGFTVRQAGTAVQALAIADERMPSIVLMDMSMPEMDGWEATRRLRANPRTRDTIIVALTARAMAKERQRALEAGCDAVVTKPFDLDALATALAGVLKHGRRGLRSLAKLGPLPQDSGGG